MTIESTQAKREYARPTLQAFGSVRNLTGGTRSSGADGALGMSSLTDSRMQI
ncbi:hypothetical protein [Aurantiacibacter poecillastricola]|uniref:hypothetical protein n=1 Tax=Aurantiacibacter poecillastricola TaxID=3064385 RepID=UPI00273E56E0|nr:hypothetical protein [Aurantiacibacter sp. 219JJ12-13]MDP5260723.1 hypothetical protein [Aurantiacibacter sp. 219JJ12-13]